MMFLRVIAVLCFCTNAMLPLAFGHKPNAVQKVFAMAGVASLIIL